MAVDSEYLFCRLLLYRFLDELYHVFLKHFSGDFRKYVRCIIAKLQKKLFSFLFSFLHAVYCLLQLRAWPTMVAILYY